VEHSGCFKLLCGMRCGDAQRFEVVRLGEIQLCERLWNSWRSGWSKHCSLAALEPGGGNWIDLGAVWQAIV